MKYLGIDFGTKRVGLAVSDEEGTIAFPRITLPNDVHLLNVVAAFIKDEKVGAVVMGDSVDYAGAPNALQKNVAEFAKCLMDLIAVEVFFEPEFMTSVQAARAPGARRDTLDASAAAIILQSFLDKRNER